MEFLLKISMIVAVGKKREIGLDNKLLWHISGDLKIFKKVTMGHHLIMGRKTFESIGRPLPGRETIILSRDNNYSQAGCTTICNLEEAIELAKNKGDDEVMIVGGASIYEQSIDLIDKLYITEVDYDGEADAFFPEFKKYKWNKISEVSRGLDEKSGYNWVFKVLEK